MPSEDRSTDPNELQSTDMRTVEKYVQSAMDRDYFRKTKKSSLAFAVFALGFGVSGMGLKKNLMALWASVAAIIAFNIFRYVYSEYLKKLEEKLGTDVYSSKKAKAMVLFNGLLWGSLFTIILTEASASSETFLFSTVAASSFVAASIIALSSYRMVAVIFNFLILGPFIVLKLIQFFNTHDTSNLYTPGLFLVLLVFATTYIRQAYQGTALLFKNEAELKFANKNLQESQVKLIEQTKKMIHSSRLASLGEMAGGIAHEINNPLAVISGHLQQIRSRNAMPEPIDKAFLNERLHKMGSAIVRISKIIKGLREFSQQSDGEPFISTPVSRIIQETVDMCGEKFRNHGVTLEVDCDVDATLFCRSVQVSQILINLLNNAFDEIKALPHPKVTLQGRLVESTLQIQVINGGKPIPEAIRQKLFQPFFTTKAIGVGTGLGLSISKGLAQDHGGDLELLEGTAETVFQLTLPIENLKNQVSDEAA